MDEEHRYWKEFIKQVESESTIIDLKEDKFTPSIEDSNQVDSSSLSAAKCIQQKLAELNERLEVKIEKELKRKVEIPKQKRLTCSFGRADRALYRAKEEGKNRIKLWKSGMSRIK